MSLYKTYVPPKIPESRRFLALGTEDWQDVTDETTICAVNSLLIVSEDAIVRISDTYG